MSTVFSFISLKIPALCQSKVLTKIKVLADLYCAIPCLAKALEKYKNNYEAFFLWQSVADGWIKIKELLGILNLCLHVAKTKIKWKNVCYTCSFRFDNYFVVQMSLTLKTRCKKAQKYFNQYIW